MKITLYTSLILLLLPFFVTAQWEQTNGPFGADEIMQIVEHDGGIFVSAAGAGIFRSREGELD